MWSVVVMDEAAAELLALPLKERQAIYQAIAKLNADGPFLGAPHTSNVEGIPDNLRELRPRRGHSPWRALYRRIGDELVIATIAPESVSNKRGFERAVKAALDRLDQYEFALGGHL